MLKKCNACKTEKALSEFGKNKNYPDGKMPTCKKCHNARVRKYQLAHPEKYVTDYNRTIRRHGLTLEEYKMLLDKYEGLCHICRIEEAKAIDHDHSCCPGAYGCGRCIRGILCHKCNQALGLMKENKVTLLNAVEYLGL